MNVLILGNGGREHALAHAISRSPRLSHLYTLPGNPGTAALGTNLPGTLDDFDALAATAREHAIDLTVVGPEAPLCAGIVDHFEAQGLRIFGPSKAAARLEGDKAYAKEMMRRALVPTAEARVFDDYHAARDYAATRDCALVVKASGLAAGKGVVVCDEPSQAMLALERIMVDGAFGEAGSTVLVEERLRGPELSAFAIVDDRTIYMLDTAQDFKRVGDGDTGPNTGGMGSVSPAPHIDAALRARIEANVFVPILDALRADGTIYRGVLYAGLMLTPAGPKVLEFNCRFGDPEAQVVLPRIRSDVLDLLDACARGSLAEAEVEWDHRPTVGVVLASAGYPDAYPTGLPITGLDKAATVDRAFVFHAGTVADGARTLTAGGRVLCVTAIDRNIAAARSMAYETARLIHFEGMHCRTDIADGALDPFEGVR